MSLIAERPTQTPTGWSRSLSGPPILDKPVKALVPALVRRWCGIDPVIDQSALSDHYLSIHLGGAKRLRRTGEGAQQMRETRNGAHSVVPAGCAFRWNTEGPVDFAHIYFGVGALDRVMREAFDRDPAAGRLREALGDDDPLIGAIAEALLTALQTDEMQQAYLDDLMHLLAVRMLRLHTDLGEVAAGAQQLLAPFRLKRALDFIEGNIAEAIGVADIAEAAGISAFHFSRAFRHATGRPPYAFLLDRRVERAKRVLAAGDVPLAAVARDCGFTSASHFSRSFRRAVGVTPGAFRNRC